MEFYQILTYKYDDLVSDIVKIGLLESGSTSALQMLFI